MPTVQREIRYLTTDELIRLRRHVEARALQAREKGTVGAVRAWALLDTLLSSGLRASEIAALRVGDCLLGYGQASLLVCQGKGGKTREVFFPPGPQSPPQGLPGVEAGQWRGCLRQSPGFHGSARHPHPERRLAGGQGAHGGRGVDPRYATHTCRHTFATHLYRASGADLEVVQEQLGHASVKTTTIYAKVTKEDKVRAADALAKAYRDSQRNSASGAS